MRLSPLRRCRLNAAVCFIVLFLMMWDAHSASAGDARPPPVVDLPDAVGEPASPPPPDQPAAVSAENKSPNTLVSLQLKRDAPAEGEADAAPAPDSAFAGGPLADANASVVKPTISLRGGEGNDVTGGSANGGAPLPSPLSHTPPIFQPEGGFSTPVLALMASVGLLLVWGARSVYRRMRTLRKNDAPMATPQAPGARSWEGTQSASDARLPRLIAPPAPNGGGPLLTDAHVRGILKHLPIRYIGSDWRLLYSSDRDGCSLKTLYRRVAHCGPVILVVVDSHGHVFGAFASEEIREGYKYFGNGESFVMRIHPDFKVYRWTHENNLFTLAHPDHLAFGGGGSFALFLDAYVERGTSGHSATYGNDVLAHRDTFKCVAVEAWGFTA